MLRYPHFSNSFGAHIGIITSDKKMVFLNRSENVHTEVGSYTCGVAEGMDSKEDVDEHGKPDIYALGKRAMAEEVGIHVEKDQITYSGLGCHPTNMHWGIVGFVDLRNHPQPEKFTSEAIRTLWRLNTQKDSWEFNIEKTAFPTFTPDYICSFIKSNQKQIEAGAFAVAVQALYGLFDEKEVTKVLFKYLYEK